MIFKKLTKYSFLLLIVFSCKTYEYSLFINSKAKKTTYRIFDSLPYHNDLTDTIKQSNFYFKLLDSEDDLNVLIADIELKGKNEKYFFVSNFENSNSKYIKPGKYLLETHSLTYTKLSDSLTISNDKTTELIIELGAGAARKTIVVRSRKKLNENELSSMIKEFKKE